MRHFTRDEWYLDGFTWCGITKEGEKRYPVSYGDNGTAWATTTDLQGCLNHMTIARVKQQLRAELKYNPFFMYHYEKVELVHIKEYPTCYFDYKNIARKLKIKLDPRLHNEEIVPHLMKYGFEPISDNPKFIETGRDNGELFREVLSEFDRDKNGIESISVKESCFWKSTYLVRTVRDLELLVETVPGCNEVAARYDDEIKGFSYLQEDILLPCFVVVDNEKSEAYSIDDVRSIADSAIRMLELVKNH